MGICETSHVAKIATENKLESNQSNEQSFNDHPPVPLDLAEEVKKSFCKINIKAKEKDNMTFGFFMKTQYSKKYLVAKYHMIPDKIIIEEIELEIYNHKKMKLNSKEFHIKYFPKYKDIILIKIKNDENILNEIKFLLCDFNIDLFIYEPIFSIELPIEEKIICPSGKILHPVDYEFVHNIPIDNNDYISPIMLLNNNISEIKIIGINRKINNSQDKNNGIFIGEIINENKDDSSFDYDTKEILNFTNVKKFEIKFISYDSHIELSIPCKREDIFSSVEEKLYEKFPELKYKNLKFYKNKKLIKTYSTLIDNDISNGDKIEFEY